MANARFGPARFRDLGPVNWLLWRYLSRRFGCADVHVFSTLGRTGRLFRGWLHYSLCLMPFGRLPRYEAELVILRIAHLRASAYEMAQHSRIGAAVGVTPSVLDRVRAGPDAEGWPERIRALLTATDELARTRDLSDQTWERLARWYDQRLLIEIVLLVNQYEGMAATLAALRVPLDLFDRPRRVGEYPATR
ncbi:carboxymuconolactone decarboxylase family protein [Nocardia panacis]|uniref:Carboxymuconolactone decarboxylase family protein n=1 Tax=Nocardia panacis TaxID=2340916 RepID=A0A3A4KD75_9NOCA|nr:carboxymuconolactone decarboxylase family protein [Nocardia panacis]RJO70815.1 carboxymuconolactone decarboxylase family protein [Nocardia panacis]